VLLVLLVATGLISWQWLGQRINQWMTQQDAPSVQQATAAFQAGDLDAAITQAEALYRADPAQSEALTLMVRALIYRSYDDIGGEQDRARALALTTDAFRRRPTDPDVMAVHAFALQAAGQPALASQIANRVLRDDPSHELARVALALAYGRVGSYQNALAASQIAVDSGGSVDARRALAISLDDLGRYEDALAAVDRAIQQNSRLLALRFEQAHYAMQIGDADRATAAYFSVLAFDPDNVKARLRMCELSSFLRESDTALTYCKEVVDLAPTLAQGWYWLGREHYLRGDFEQAQTALGRCSGLEVLQGVPVTDRTFDCWYLQGQAAELRGDCDALLRVYDEYQSMAAETALPQTWTYPPEGPPICTDPTTVE
jgi:tetratricopeptide (TPR) repeat protein